MSFNVYFAYRNNDIITARLLGGTRACSPREFENQYNLVHLWIRFCLQIAFLNDQQVFRGMQLQLYLSNVQTLDI